MKPSPPEDRVAIVGSGIVGTTIAFLLTKRGVRVDLFEKGPPYPYPHQSQFEDRILHLHENPSYSSPPDLKSLTTSGRYRMSINDERRMVVGGTATQWGAVTPRLHPNDFRTRSAFSYGADWPISYDTLEPFYGRAEALLGVSGDAGDNPYAPPRSQPYPLPPFELGHDTRRFAELLAADDIVLHTTAQARARQAFDGRPGCVNFGACGTCPIGARYSPNHHLAQALATGLCTLHSQTSVRRVLVDANRRARALVVRPHGEAEREHAASAVVVAGGAIESARLLLISKCSRNPDGLGNHSGQLGKNLMFHHLWSGHLDYDEPQFPERAGPAMGQSQRFVDPPTRGQHGGVLLELPSEWSRPFHAMAPSKWRDGREALEAMRATLNCELVWLLGETRPGEGKQVTLSDKSDRFGDPFAHVHYEPDDFDTRTHAFAQTILERVGRATRAAHWQMMGPDGFVSGHHHLGVCRMSQNPADGVVDPDCRVHGSPNLFVVGGSTFASSGALHPTLTMVALAIRASDHLLAG